MKTVLAFGDSNTWGLAPGSNPKERYGRDVRWTGLLEELVPGIRVAEEGLCGRTTVFEDELRKGRKGIDSLPTVLETHAPIDAVILMLGTNDCKTIYQASPYVIGKGIERCIEEIEKVLPASKILLVSPIVLGADVWRADKDPEFGRESVTTVGLLPEVYKRIAAAHGTAFLAASDYAGPNPADDEHLDAEGHRALASALAEELKLILR